MKRNGFTLIELLVVIAIILLLLGILVGAVGQFSAAGSTTAARAMMAAVEMGINSYSNDFGSVPPSSGTLATSGTAYSGNGGNLLAAAMFGPAATDGQQGLGFKAPGSTTTYGPYLNAKHDSTMGGTLTAPTITMADSPGKKAVLYYRWNPSASGTGWGTIFGTTGRFVSTHNSTLAGSDNPAAFWQSENPYGASGTPAHGKWTAFVTPFRAAKYLAIYPGPDDKYGTKDDLLLTGR